MTWQSIGNFLGRFSGFKVSQGIIKDEARKAIKNLSGIEIGEIEERKGILILKIDNPAIKNEIFLKKDVILDALFKTLADKAPKDIRFN